MKKKISKSLENAIEQLKVSFAESCADRYSLRDHVEDNANKYAEIAEDSPIINKSFLKDGYSNSISAIGEADKVKSFTSYGFDNDSLNFPLWVSLYNDSWVFRRAIDKPAQDMVRSGIELILDNKIDVVQRRLKSQRKNLIELIQWGRLFGGAVAIVMFDNFKDEDYKKPIDINKLKKAKTMTMYVTDRRYGCNPSTKLVGDVNNIVDYGKPYCYDITFADGHTFKVHHDYVLRYEGRSAPRFIKNGYLQGRGYAEGAHILNELARDDQLKSSISSLINKSLIEVVKMNGMKGVFMGADAQNQEQLTKRLEMVNWARTYNSLTLLDKEDDYQQNTFSGLTGLADLLEQNMLLISSALEMSGILYGPLEKGFSNDSNALERYDETINNLNENYFRPCVYKLLSIIYKWEGIDEKIDFTFGSIIKSKQDKDRIEAFKDFQQLLSGMLNDGILTPKQYAIAIKNFGEKGIIDLGLSDEDIEKLDDKMEEEMENIKIDEN